MFCLHTVESKTKNNNCVNAMSLFLCTNLHLESDTKSDWETNDSKGFSSPVALQFSYASVSEMPEDYSISQ